MGKGHAMSTWGPDTEIQDHIDALEIERVVLRASLKRLKGLLQRLLRDTLDARESLRVGFFAIAASKLECMASCIRSQAMHDSLS